MRWRASIAAFLAFCVAMAQAQDAAALFRQAAERERTDIAAAARLYEQSARMGYAPSLVRLGSLRQSGPGYLRDLPGAFALFSQAAQAGNLDGQFMLAMTYAQGAGTAKDPAAARKWFLQPAAADYQYAQYALGIMLESGEGGPRKVAASRRWLDRAATGADPKLAAQAVRLRDQVDAKLFAMDTSGTMLVGLVLFMALAGTVIQENTGTGFPSASNPSGSPGGSSPSVPPVRCHVESLFGGMTLNGQGLATPSQQTRVVCE